MKILETDRLILRRLLPEDLDALFALYSDPEIRRYFPEGTLTYEETKEELITRQPPHNWLPALQLELFMFITVHIMLMAICITRENL